MVAGEKRALRSDETLQVGSWGLQNGEKEKYRGKLKSI